MFHYSDNPNRDFDRWEREQERALEDCIHCAECGEPIQGDYAYQYEDDFYCEECVEAHRVRIN